MHVNVQGGTGGGRRMHVRTEPRKDWRCANGHVNKAAYTGCWTPGCREKRAT